MSDKISYYLVDYENVGVEGLKGVAGLPSNAQIHLFSTSLAEKMSTKVLSTFNGKNLMIHEVANGTQSVDKHLVSFLGYLIGQHESTSTYVIVSKDKGYDNLISFAKKEMGVSVLRQERLDPIPKPVVPSGEKKAVTQANMKATQATPEKKEHQIRCFFGQHFKEKQYQDNKEVIIQAVLASKTKTQVNTKLTQVFPSDEVKTIYGRLKPFIEEWPGQ